MIGVAIPGAAGRMGRMLIQELHRADGVKLAAATEQPGHATIEQDAGTIANGEEAGVKISADLGAMVGAADCIIDFTLPQVTEKIVWLAAEEKTPLVIGTTGHSDEQATRIREASQAIPVVWAPNMSVGVNVLLGLVSEATRLLADDYDIEVIEAHHRHKRDAPSGTALQIAEVLAEASSSHGPLAERICYGRQGETGARPKHQIAVHTVRGGEIPGEHTVLFCGEYDRIELTHRAAGRQAFARGAVRAARWVVSQSPGLYSMKDVLGL